MDINAGSGRSEAGSGKNVRRNRVHTLPPGKVRMNHAAPNPPAPPSRAPLRRHGLGACLGACLAAALPARAGQCGTALFFERANRLGPAAALHSLARPGAAEDGYRARTLVSEHFLIHYSLRAWHRVHLDASDSLLARRSDSLYAAFSGLATDARDSAVYARLDSLAAPHPLFVRKVAQYFEAARAYYVDALGMKAPSSPVVSVHYRTDPSLPRLFPVDVVDVGSADPAYAGETYAITYPTASLSISFENDFLCYTRLDAQGRIQGTPIASRLGGKLIHDYSVEWELGIKVTAFHEFYHAVQFAYIPRVSNYHAWYEISAVGMEERNAPEVDDYLQYLPCVLYNHESVSLTAMGFGPCTHSPMYGQGIFHQYLSRALDSSFDVKVWDRLSHNGDDLSDGLENAFARYGKSMSVLFPEFAAENLFAGRRFAPPDPAVWSTGGLYSDDFPKWPDLSVTDLDLAVNPYLVRSLPPLTYGVLRIAGGGSAPAKVLHAQGGAVMTRIDTSPDSSRVERIGGGQAVLGAPRPGFDAYYLVIPNPSFTAAAAYEIKDPDAEFYAYPNPASAASMSLFFSPAKDMAFPARVRIYSESGRLRRTLDFAAAENRLEWDLKDAAGGPVKPGIYYYRLEEGPLRPLVVLR